MTVSYEISDEYRDDWPPFSDGCERCIGTDWRGTVVPFATVTNGDSLTAFYHHGRCGYQWFTSWGAQYSHTWLRVMSGERGRALPGGRRQIAASPTDGDAVAA